MTKDADVHDIDVRAVWRALSSSEGGVLVDVRTGVEWENVGIPDLSELNQNVHFVSWQLSPDMRINPEFVKQLQASGVPKGEPVYFLCRSGVRSRAAAIAATEAGFGPCFNVAEGFEGVEAGPLGRRTGGWRGSRLPETTVGATA